MPRFRSVLYVPASNDKAMAKAAQLPADALIIDLEDAVAPEAKAEARLKAKAMLESGAFEGRKVILRVNGFEAGDHLAEDLASLLPAAPYGVLFPKIRTPEDAERAERALDMQAAPHAITLWLMVETPQALVHINAIAALKTLPNARLTGLVLGTNDLAKEMRIPPTPSRLAFLHAFCATILAAKAYDMIVLDGVYGDIRDQAGFEAEALQAKGLGFDGKTLIHPGQIEAANRIFAPSEAEISEAKRIIAAFEAPENAGRGVLALDGVMVERLHYESAKRLLEII